MVRKTLAAAGLLLVAFHVWLLGQQMWDGRLADAAVVARWLAAGGLGAALLHLRRRGVPLVRSREAVAVWVLAALLHGPAIGQRLGPMSVPDVPEVIVVVASATAAGLLLAGLALLAVRLAGTARRPARPAPAVDAPARRRPFGPDAFPALRPRPPPSLRARPVL